MASMEANVDLRFATGPMAGGPHQFRIPGTVYHCMGPLIPKNNENARFAQVYIMETEDQLRAWHGLAFAQSLPEPLLIGLGNMLKEHNAYAKVFRQAASLHDPDVTIMLRCASNLDPSLRAHLYQVPFNYPSETVVQPSSTAHFHYGFPTVEPLSWYSNKLLSSNRKTAIFQPCKRCHTP